MQKRTTQDSLKLFWIKELDEYRHLRTRSLRVGIVTSFTKNYNYGAVVQAYALARFTGIFVRSCKQINYSASPHTVGSHPARRSTPDLSAARQEAVHGIAKRKRAMQRFMERIPQTQTVFTAETLASAARPFDAFVCGSDVIWGTKARLNNSFYWLNFVPQDSKIKIAYAPSLKTIDWTADEENRITKLVSSFDALSVRESDGKDFLERLLRGSKHVSHVLDPTLLLPRETWRHVAKRADVGGRYIFVYLLGDSYIQRRAISEFARTKGLPIVTLPHCVSFRPSDTSFGDTRLYDIDPTQWIWLIDHAEYVFTDSFHGAVFSSMFHKNFFIYNREMSEGWTSLGNRMKSLTSMWGIERVVLADHHPAKDIDRISPIDYNRLDSVTDRMRRASARYLLSALEGGCRRLKIGE